MVYPKPATRAEIFKAFAANYQIIKVKPALLFFLIRYMKRFRVINIEGNLVLHSHLPPLNSKAYSRFIDEHLLMKKIGPTHAQIGLTNACPQNCRYCYNKNRCGNTMDTATIIQLIRDLKKMGVKPGPVYTKILEELFEARLRGSVKSREDEEDFVKNTLQR